MKRGGREEVIKRCNNSEMVIIQRENENCVRRFKKKGQGSWGCKRKKKPYEEQEQHRTISQHS